MNPRDEQLADGEPMQDGLDSSPERPNGQPANAREWAGSLQSQAWEAFTRDLDQLLLTHRGKWVAYRGSRRICIGDSESDVYKECFKHGLPPAEVFVDMVYPAAAEIPEVFLPPSEGSLSNQAS